MRNRVAAAALCLLLLALAGCTTPAPSDPTPTPTPAFSSEEEAFAAAEETYRAYVDALNQVDLSDPTTFEPVYELTTADANAEARKTFTAMHADGWVVEGISEATVIEPRAAGNDLEHVELAVCLDVSDVTLVDSTGESMVSADRPDVQRMLVTLDVTEATTTGFAISDFSGRDDGPTC